MSGLCRGKNQTSLRNQLNRLSLRTSRGFHEDWRQAVRNRRLDRPIFVIGCARSGTTLLYELLARHPELGWFSTLTARHCHPPLAVLSRLWPRIDQRGIPKPSEGYPLWDRCIKIPKGDPPLDEHHHNPESAKCLEDLISKHLFWQGRTRFINKNTRNSRRIRLLHRIFPDAMFVHVIRHPTATVASLMHVRWWDSLPLWTRNAATPTQLRLQGEDDVALAADLWVAETTQVLKDRSVLNRENYLEVRYETLTREPARSIYKAQERLGLSVRVNLFGRAAPDQITNQNYRARTRLDRNELGTIKAICSETAENLGYSFE